MAQVKDIFDYMIQNNLTQKELAKILGVSYCTINKILNNKKNLSKRINRKFELICESKTQE